MGQEESTLIQEASSLVEARRNEPTVSLRDVLSNKTLRRAMLQKLGIYSKHSNKIKFEQKAKAKTKNKIRNRIAKASKLRNRK